MSSPFVGEIRMFGGTFAPVNWAFCNGQLIAISQNEALFNLIGTTYGGDGVNTFALPNLQGRAPVHQGTPIGGPTYIIGQLGGAESVTLTANQLPSHTHPVAVAGAGTVAVPATNTLLANEVLVGSPGSVPQTYIPFSNANTQVGLGPNSVTVTGGSQPHDNMIPFVVVNFIISLFGIFPSQS